MKVDLHCHTSPASACSCISLEEIARTARLRGLDGIALTNHYRYPSDEDIQRIQEIEPDLKIFKGTEISLENPDATEGWEDIIVIADEDPTPLHPIQTNDLDDFKAFVAETEALVIHAHPYRFHDSIVYDPAVFRPDAVEIASWNINLSMHDKIIDFCRENDLKAIATSDAHRTWAVGIHHIELDRQAQTERQLAAVVREGAFTMLCHEEMFQDRRDKVVKEEALARKILFDKGDVHVFLQSGGNAPDVFRRVASGQTSLPNEKAVGLRNPV
jgi:predicted metal-dependent phosphoesterase TrpH